MGRKPRHRTDEGSPEAAREAGHPPNSSFLQEYIFAQVNAATTPETWGTWLWATLQRVKSPTQVFSRVMLQENDCCWGRWVQTFHVAWILGRDPLQRSTEIWGDGRSCVIWLLPISGPRFWGSLVKATCKGAFSGTFHMPSRPYPGNRRREAYFSPT